MSGFGLWLLVRQGFLGAKAPLQSGFAKETAFFSAKAQNCKKLCFLRLYAGVLWRNLARVL